MAKTRVLIAVDDPVQANKSVHTAYNFIDRKNSEVTLLNVIETTVAEENFFYSEPEKFIEHESEKSDFAFLENFLENSEVDYKGFIYKEGDAAETIVKFTDNNKYDLLVIGSHNRNPLERFLLGSVAYKVTRFGKSSVLVIPNKYHLPTGMPEDFSVLTGVDLSGNCLYSAENLYKFIDKNRAKVTLLHATVPASLIIPPDAYIYIDMAQIIKESNIVSENLLNLISDKLEATGINVVNKYHIEADADSAIIDEAKENKHDLIVVGTHAGSDLSKQFFGSVSTKISEHAKQPVLIIKKP